jgi:hypothetical protein
MDSQVTGWQPPAVRTCGVARGLRPDSCRATVRVQARTAAGGFDSEPELSDEPSSLDVMRTTVQ